MIKLLKQYRTFILIVLCSTLLSACFSFNNKQLGSQLESLGLNVTEDERGLIVSLPTVFFDFDSSNLKTDSRTKIADIASIVNHPQAADRMLSIEGHTDNIGSPVYNLELSKERANVVMQELAFSNINEERLSSQGFGDKKPIADNNTSEGRQLNRRVDIVILN